MNFFVTTIHKFTLYAERKRAYTEHIQTKGARFACIRRKMFTSNQIRHHVVVALYQKDRPCDITYTNILCDFLSFFEMSHMLTCISLWSSFSCHHIHDIRINNERGGGGGGGDAGIKSYMEFSLFILQKMLVFFYLKPFLLLSLITIFTPYKIHNWPFLTAAHQECTVVEFLWNEDD